MGICGNAVSRTTHLLTWSILSEGEFEKFTWGCQVDPAKIGYHEKLLGNEGKHCYIDHVTNQAPVFLKKYGC